MIPELERMSVMVTILNIVIHRLVVWTILSKSEQLPNQTIR